MGNIFSNPITLDDLMDDDSNSGGEMVNISDVFNTVPTVMSESPPSSPEVKPLARPSIIVKKENVKIEPSLQKGGNDFLYVESKRARLEREKEERKLREETSVAFSAEDLALATIPGADFDPTRRQFSSDELRPQPIIRKRQKLLVDYEKKDDKYWEKRGKNNIAARRSREARRLKENQIALRTAYLEKQNAGLKAALSDANLKNKTLEMETRILKERLEKLESMAAFLE